MGNVYDLTAGVHSQDRPFHRPGVFSFPSKVGNQGDNSRAFFFNLISRKNSASHRPSSYGYIVSIRKFLACFLSLRFISCTYPDIFECTVPPRSRAE